MFSIGMSALSPKKMLWTILYSNNDNLSVLFGCYNVTGFEIGASGKFIAHQAAQLVCSKQQPNLILFTAKLSFQPHYDSLVFKRLESNKLSQQIHVDYELTFLFKVSKTTIWRRLQQSGGNKQIKFLESNTDLAESDLNFQEVTEIPVTYCDERETYPLIILTPNTTLTNDISYQSSDNIIVESVLESDNVENVGEIIEIQETPSYSEEIADCQDEDNS